MLMREPGSGTRLLAERFLVKNGVNPRIGMEISSNETIKQAVIAGLGIAFISAHTIAAEIADRRLIVLDVVGLPELRQWFVVRPAAKRLMPAARALARFSGRRGPPVSAERGGRGSYEQKIAASCEISIITDVQPGRSSPLTHRPAA